MSVCRIRLLLSLALLAGGVLCFTPARAVTPQERLSLAVVRIISHGCSGTVIYSEEGRSFILSCGHAFRGSDRNRPVVLDVPATRPGPPQNPGIQVLETD